MKWWRRKNKRCAPKRALSVRHPWADTAIASSADGMPTAFREQNDPLHFENKLTWMWTKLDNFELNYGALGARFSPVYDSFHYHSTCFFWHYLFCSFHVRYSLVTFNLEINDAALLFGIVFFLFLLYFQPFIRRSLKTIPHVYLDCSYFGMNTVGFGIEFFESYK